MMELMHRNDKLFKIVLTEHDIKKQSNFRIYYVYQVSDIFILNNFTSSFNL